MEIEAINYNCVACVRKNHSFYCEVKVMCCHEVIANETFFINIYGDSAITYSEKHFISRIILFGNI